MAINTRQPERATENPDCSPRRGEIFFYPEELAMNLTETFSGHHMTPARRLAAKLIIEMPADIEEVIALIILCQRLIMMRR